MSARIVIGCDGDWNGMPCRAALRIPAARVALARNDDLADLYKARNVAFDAGWRQTPGGTGDLCPAHARAQEFELFRAAAHDLMRAGLPVPELDEKTAAWLTTRVYAPDRSRTP